MSDSATQKLKCGHSLLFGVLICALKEMNLREHKQEINALRVSFIIDLVRAVERFAELRFGLLELAFIKGNASQVLSEYRARF